MEFRAFNLNETLLEAIDYMGFKDATPIQEQAIPLIIGGDDLIACAQTGTGKTAAFLLPLIHNILSNPRGGVRGVIIAPTRELALQIDNQIQGIGYFAGVRSIAIYGGGGGEDWEQEKKALTEGTDIIVATPGKLLAHLNMGYVKFDTVETLILDEADRMLDIGFYEDIIKIREALPDKIQNLMFSATMAPKIRKLAKKILVEPKEVSLAIAKPAAGVLQAAYLTYDNQKTPLIRDLIADQPNYKSIIIFTSTRKKVSEITRGLIREKYHTEGISSDLAQSEREEVLRKFRAKKIRVLVATDIVSRGIDIKDINLVINYDVPGDAADYVHRVGRTARANTSGVALTFVNEDDMYKFSQIETLIEKEVMKIPLPPEFGEAPVWNVSKKRKKKGGYKRSKGRSKGYNRTKR